MDRLHQWAAGAMGAMIVCLVAALALTRWKAWLLFGLAVLFLAGAVVLLVVSRLGRPKLVFDESKTEPRFFNYARGLSTTEPHGVTGIGPQGPRYASTAASVPAIGTPTVPFGSLGSEDCDAFFMYAFVRNVPRVGCREARDVHPWVIFRDTEGQILYEMQGRWSDSPQSAPELTQRAQERTLAANDNPARLDVAFQATKDGLCFAFNDESYFSADYRNRPLGKAQVDVEIIVKGTGRLRDSQRYQLIPGDKTNQPCLIREW